MTIELLNKKTVSELREIAKENGLTDFLKLKKAELVELIFLVPIKRKKRKMKSKEMNPQK